MSCKPTILSGILVLTSLAAQVFSATPLLIINEYHFGFDTQGPTLVVYDDGRVIYQFPNARLEYFRSNTGAPPWPVGLQYMAAKFDKPEELIERLLPSDWAQLKPDYEERGWTDDVTTVIWKSGKFVRVYGEWRDHIRPPEKGDHLTNRMPQTLRDSLKRFDDFNPPSAIPWLPEYLTLGVYSTSPRHKPLAPAKWPSNFPKLTDVKRASKVDDSIVAQVRLPGRDFPLLRELIKDSKDEALFLIDQRTVILSWVRFEFPEQEALEKALRSAMRE